MEEIEHFITHYCRGGVSWIDSGIHTNSGEFFLHPDAVKILEYLANAHKLSAYTEVFTNGMNLTVDHIKTLKKLKPYVYLSLNSAHIYTRRALMGGSYPQNKNAIGLSELLSRYAVPHCVWLVPLRDTIRTGDLEDSIRYLKKSKAKAIQLHKPGYTRYTPLDIADQLSISDKEILDFAAAMREKYRVKINTMGRDVADKFREVYCKVRYLFKNFKRLSRTNTLFLCAETVKDIFPLALNAIGAQGYDIQPVSSKVFGGNIDCAGLLLVEDYIAAIEEFLKKARGKKPKYAILPRASFDIATEDLSMTPLKIIQEKYRIKVIII
jgi:hypothetical protein